MVCFCFFNKLKMMYNNIIRDFPGKRGMDNSERGREREEGKRWGQGGGRERGE